MSRVPTATFLFVLVGLLVVTNGLWLFPHDGDQRYSYERTQITVENGTFDYRGDDTRRYHHENDLVDVGCQPEFDGVGRDCAFDRHLAAAGPVTVTAAGITGNPPFVRLNDGYYRRVAIRNESNTTYDVERVAPRAILADVASNVSDVDPSNLDRNSPLQYRVAVTGDPQTTFDRVDADRLGQVYRRGGDYYTVVLTDETTVDRPFVSQQLRELTTVVGIGLLLAAGLLGVRRIQRGDERPGPR